MEIGKELGVRYVLEGSVQGDQNNAQLVDAESGAHLWADRFEEDVTDLFKLHMKSWATRLQFGLGLDPRRSRKGRSVQKSARLSRFQPLRSPVEPLPNRGRGSALAAHGRAGAGRVRPGGSAVAGHPELMAAAHVTRNGTPYAAAAIARMIA
jgi:hypothetical protein